MYGSESIPLLHSLLNNRMSTLSHLLNDPNLCIGGLGLHKHLTLQKLCFYNYDTKVYCIISLISAKHLAVC